MLAAYLKYTQLFEHLKCCRQWLLVALVYFSLQIQENQSHIFTGRQCTSGGHANIPGECKLLADCPSAISNFRAGVSPSVCYQENDVSLVCCQTGKRISALKCDEFSAQLFEQHSKASIPGFAPFYAGNYDENPRYGNGAPPSSGTCDHINTLPFISGGRPADRHEMSFTVAIGYDDPAKDTISWKCGGTLISEQYVLTAAHCLDGKASKPPTHVLLGDKHLLKLDTFTSSQRIEARVETIIIHPEHKRPAKYNDIGLIKLDRKVKFGRMIQPACLPQAEQRPETLGMVDQWCSSMHHFIGSIRDLRLPYLGQRGDVLQVANITRYNSRECKQAYKSVPELPDGIVQSQVCAGDKEGSKDTCDGDSGGPLVSKQDKTTCMHTIIGLTSFGDQFCGSGTPAIYTNILSYVDWIESEVWKDVEAN